MIDAGRRSKWRSTSCWIFASSIVAGAERLDRERDRAGDADAVGDLDLEPVGEAGRDDVLRHPARRVRRGAVDLRRVLARERAAAVTGHAAVRVDDDLAAGQAGVAHRPAGHEPAGRVDVHHRVDGAQRLGDDRQDDRLRRGRCGSARRGRRGRAATRRRPSAPASGTPRSYSTVTWVLPSGPEVRQLAGLADLGEPARHAVRERDRQRHQLRRLAAGEPEHHPLVAGAELDARAPRPTRTSSAASTPIAMSGDCSLTDTSVPQVR